MKKSLLLSLASVSALCVALGTAIAKLPPPSDEAKAKAAEAKAKADEVAKKDAADLGRYQDRVADKYYAAQKAAGKAPTPSQWVPPPPAPAPAAAAPASAPAAAAAPKK